MPLFVQFTAAVKISTNRVQQLNVMQLCQLEVGLANQSLTLLGCCNIRETYCSLSVVHEIAATATLKPQHINSSFQFYLDRNL